MQRTQTETRTRVDRVELIKRRDELRAAEDQVRAEISDAWKRLKRIESERLQVVTAIYRGK